MAEPLDVDKGAVPPGGNVNKPASGTYGEGAALDRLKRALPGVNAQPGQTPPQGPDPGRVAALPPAGKGPNGAPGGGAAGSPIPGIPAPIIRPSDRPNVPVSAQAPEVAGEAIPTMVQAEGRLRVIAALQQSDDPDTREWANLVMEMLTS